MSSVATIVICSLLGVACASAVAFAMFRIVRIQQRKKREILEGVSALPTRKLTIARGGRIVTAPSSQRNSLRFPKWARSKISLALSSVPMPDTQNTNSTLATMHSYSYNIMDDNRSARSMSMRSEVDIEKYPRVDMAQKYQKRNSSMQMPQTAHTKSMKTYTISEEESSRQPSATFPKAMSFEAQQKASPQRDDMYSSKGSTKVTNTVVNSPVTLEANTAKFGPRRSSLLESFDRSSRKNSYPHPQAQSKRSTMDRRPSEDIKLSSRSSPNDTRALPLLPKSANTIVSPNASSSKHSFSSKSPGSSPPLLRTSLVQPSTSALKIPILSQPPAGRRRSREPALKLQTSPAPAPQDSFLNSATSLASSNSPFASISAPSTTISAHPPSVDFSRPSINRVSIRAPPPAPITTTTQKPHNRQSSMTMASTSDLSPTFSVHISEASQIRVPLPLDAPVPVPLMENARLQAQLARSRQDRLNSPKTITPKTPKTPSPKTTTPTAVAHAPGPSSRKPSAHWEPQVQHQQHEIPVPMRYSLERKASEVSAITSAAALERDQSRKFFTTRVGEGGLGSGAVSPMSSVFRAD